MCGQSHETDSAAIVTSAHKQQQQQQQQQLHRQQKLQQRQQQRSGEKERKRERERGRGATRNTFTCSSCRQVKGNQSVLSSELTQQAEFFCCTQIDRK